MLKSAKATKIITAVVIMIFNILLAFLDDSFLALFLKGFVTLFLTLFSVSRESVDVGPF